jgi:hypothetical protein
MKLNGPIVMMETTPDGKGYWLFGADGGVFTYGNAKFYGSTGNSKLTHPVVAMMATPSGKGYWLVTSAGRGYGFGNAPSFAGKNRTDIVGISNTGSGLRLITKSLQLIAA